MLRALAGSVVALVLAPGAAGAAGPLERYVPVVVHDSRERSPLTSVEAFAGTLPGIPAGRPTPTVYGRQAGGRLQYWLLFASNDQDRGILRTGRHAGDWEMVQYRIRDGALVRGVYTQHSGAERCPVRAIRMTPRGHPLVFLANGSHAAYFVPGVRDRTWPDPNDEADGEGVRVRPRLVPITAGTPAWMRDGRPWGGARAGWVPGEMDSPRGPAFQPQRRWSDPAAWARAARSCTRTGCDELGECDGRETRAAATAAGAGALVALLYGWRRSRRVTAANAAAGATPPPAGR